MEQANRLYTNSFYVRAVEANAQAELPLPLLVNHLAETATRHAEELGIGYSTLIKKNLSWVLARLSVELERYPRIGEVVVVETWIESINKHFSSRNFRLATSEGTVLGYARTIWSMLDLGARTAVELTAILSIQGLALDAPCPIAPATKLRATVSENPTSYHVTVSDIDLNRHMASYRYVAVLLDRLPLSVYDEHHIARFDITYMNEARYEADLLLHQVATTPTQYALEVTNSNNEPHCRCKISLAPRTANE